MTKVAFVGTGNATLTRKILSDLFTCADLRGTLRVALHDVDPDRLRVSEVLARRLDGEARAGALIEAEHDRKPALDGADFVVSQLEVGGYPAILRDFEVPRRHGVRQTVADTVGLGGIFRGLRTVPALVALGYDMAALCPQAWLLNCSDPMATLCSAVYTGSPFGRVVGLCHGVRDTHALLADLVGRDLAEVSFVTAGVNHQAFVLTFEADGRSLYPDLDAVIRADPALRHQVRTEIYRHFGYFPSESDAHAAEYVPWYLRHDAEVARLGIPVDDHLRRCGHDLDRYERLRRALAAGDRLLPRWKPPEMAFEVMHSIITGTPRRVSVNVANEGLVDNLPAHACVEVPAVVDGAGVRPAPVGALPVQLAALNRVFLNVVELTVAAAVEESRSAVYQAAMLDPNTAATLPAGRIVALCDELIDAHAGLLPDGITAGPPGCGW
jgi:alpha-galactosidase